MLFKVAWRNIWRNTKRSLIIIGAVTIGLSTGIFLMAFYNGMLEQRVRSAIESEISHIQLHHPEFRKENDIRFYLPDGSSMLRQIQSNPDILSVAGRFIIKGMIASASGSSGVSINGVMPDAEKKLTGLNSKVKEGSYFSPQKRNEILIGEKLMQKLKLKHNNKIVLTFQDKEGTIVSAAFRVVGIFKTINTPYDEGNVFVKITDVDSIAGLPGRFNEIALLLHSNTMLLNTLNQLKKNYPSIEIKSWDEISPEIGLIVSVAEQMVFIFLGIILLALAFGIVNTMMMAVLERTRELSMLLALGMNRLKIFSMILLETVLLVLAGCPGGILIAFIAVGITHKTGMSFSKFSEVYSSFGFSNLIFPSITVNQFITSMLMVLLTALISSLFPAWRALKVKPIVSARK